MEKSSGKKQDPTGLAKHLHDIKLQAILDGYKPGVEIHQATLHLKKLEAADRVLLQAHIKHAEHCKTLSAHEIASASKEEILQSRCAGEAGSRMACTLEEEVVGKGGRGEGNPCEVADDG